MKKLLLIIIGILIFTTAEAKTPTVFNVKIRGNSYNQTGYTALKANRVNRVREMKTIPLTRNEAREWLEIASIELKDCPIILKMGDDIIEVINNKIEVGCL